LVATAVTLLHAINDKKGLQIIFDVLSELFYDLDNESKITLKSMKKEKWAAHNKSANAIFNGFCT